MKNKLFFLFCLFGFVGEGVAQKEEVYYQKGQTFAVSIKGIPVEEQEQVKGLLKINPKTGTIKLTYLKELIYVAGLTASQIENKIEKAYKDAEIFTNPTVKVDPTETAIALTCVVGGEVRNPGPVEWSSLKSLYHMVMERGGPNQFGRDKVDLIRKGKKIGTYNLNDDLSKKIYLEPNDAIVVQKMGILK